MGITGRGGGASESDYGGDAIAAGKVLFDGYWMGYEGRVGK